MPVRAAALLIGAAVLAAAAPLIAQNGASPPPGQAGAQYMAPNIYLDCSERICDHEYIKTEITFVNYVRDRQSADVHIIVTRQQTGSGGNEYNLRFIGLGRNKGRDADLKFVTKPTDTSDQVRRAMVNTLKQGLVTYVYDTPLSEFISVTYTRREDVRPTPTQDPWKYWTFSVGLRGNANLESLTKRYSYNLSASANRTTEAEKIRAFLSGNFNERRYTIDEGETIISRSDRKNASVSYIRSITGQWSWAASSSLYKSTYDNADLFTSGGAGLEYNIFPYAESTRREMRVQYQLGISRRDYIEPTIFEKLRETLFNQQLQIIFEMKEPWGSVGASLRGSTFLHDWSKNNLRLETGIYVNLFKGLSFNASGEYSLVRDQLSLPSGGASREEILLELKRLATDYNIEFQIGFNYRFGSIYSNVVNPRFGNM